MSSSPPSKWPLGGLLTVTAFAAAPFAGYFAENTSEGLALGQALPYALVPAIPAILAVLGVWRLFGWEAASRAAVALALAVFVFFHFHEVADAVESLELPNYLDLPADTVELGAWSALFVTVSLAGFGLARWQVFRSWALLAGLLLVAVPLVAQAIRTPTTSIASKYGHLAQPDARATPPREDLPNVYFFLFDGYVGSPQLARVFNYDNSPFERALEDKGFRVAEGAYAHYPSTLFSLSSTLMMDYFPVGKERATRPLADVMTGANPAVAQFRRLGYRYVHVPHLGGTGCSGVEDLCVEPDDGLFGQVEKSLLELTPVAISDGALEWFTRQQYKRAQGGGEVPAEVVRRVRNEVGEPVFTFAHMLYPHPPYRFTADCESVGTAEHIGEWPPGERDGYLANLKCTNRRALEGVDAILRDDPNAIVLIQGDHGSASSGDQTSDPRSWPTRLIHERFSILNAVKLPDGCAHHFGDRAAPVNTFRIVLACLRGEKPRTLPYRSFLVESTVAEEFKIDRGRGD